jgi:hypothetical protein
MNDTLTPQNDTLTPQPEILQPEQPLTMSLPNALKLVIEGKRIAKQEWKNADYCLLKDGWLKIFHKKEGDKLPNFHTWIINDGDLLGEDWIVLPDLS